MHAAIKTEKQRREKKKRKDIKPHKPVYWKIQYGQQLEENEGDCMRYSLLLILLRSK